MNKKVKKVLAAALAVIFSLSMLTVPVPASTVFAASGYDVENEVLYFDQNGNMGYNVVHECTLTGDTVIADSTGSGITTLEALKAAEVDNAVSASLSFDENDYVVKINVTSVVKRPVVGISWKSDKIGTDYEGFAEAYRRNGAEVIFLPQFTSQEEAEAYLEAEGIDGVFETGGSDVNPYFYGELQTPYGSGNPNNDRDVSDIALIRAAIKKDVPLLGVCRGEQIFNVAMGGGLIQDIPYYLGEKVKSGEIDVSRVTKVLCGVLPGQDASEAVADTGYLKRDFTELPGTPDPSGEKTCEEGALRVWVDGYIHSGSPSYHALDKTAIDSDSKWLYKIAGGSEIELVATAHHQAVNPEKLGEGLTIVAHSGDGIVEAIEYQENLFALGIQFHPERDALGDSKQAVNSGMDPDQDTCNRFLRTLVLYASVHDGSLTKEEVEGTVPEETTPAETTPAETTPEETTPAETTPAETTPEETTPAETTPAETTPAETTPAETTPAETTASASTEDIASSAESSQTAENTYAGNTPDTGDDTSVSGIAYMGIIMMVSGAAIVVMRKKYHCAD